MSEPETFAIPCPRCRERVHALPNPTTADRLGSYRQIDVTDRWECNVCSHGVTIKSRDAGAPFPTLQQLREVEIDLRHDFYGDDRKRMQVVIKDVLRRLGWTDEAATASGKRRRQVKERGTA